MTLVIDASCKGSRLTRRFVLNDGERLLIGRSNDDLNLAADPRLSREHFVIRYVDEHIEVKHLSRTNPTLVASLNSVDFKEVGNVRVEHDACRIIAGSHRFVIAVEAPDSVISPTLSGEEQLEQWSDVDSEESAIHQPAVFSEDERAGGDQQASRLPRQSFPTHEDGQKLAPVLPDPAEEEVDFDQNRLTREEAKPNISSPDRKFKLEIEPDFFDD